MSESSLRYLMRWAALVEDRIRIMVKHRRTGDPAPDDPFRGLYLTDEVVDQLLAPAAPAPRADWTARAEMAAEADAAIRQGTQIRLRQLALDAALSDLDVEILVIAMVPDLDSRFERLYGYLNDDVTRRRATIGLALSLADVSTASASARARLSPGAPLIDRALVQVDDPDRPFLTRALRVPDRVTAYLLGDDAPDPELSDILVELPRFGGQRATGLARALSAGQQLVYVRDPAGGLGPSIGAAALATVGRPVIGVDLERLAASRSAVEVVAVLGREALLRGAGVVAWPVEALADPGPAAAATSASQALRRLAEAPAPVLIVGAMTWDPSWTERVPLVLEPTPLTPGERSTLWQRELDRTSTDSSIEVASLPVHFVLGPGQVSRAVRAARAATLVGDGELTADHLRRGARAQNAAGLERLARRIEPAVGWDDLVLPDTSRRQLRELAGRARHRDRVLVEWRMRPGGGRGRGVTALFAGDSGTGKTMSAEVIAGELGLDLYTVNLATVVDKYVGETEKNLERIFAEAGGVNAVLLFDEADAIFGKRSEVRDAHDRYANIESAYLLQRMETFDGLAILATNLRANIDEAFTRRLDMIIDFPAPDEQARLAIWQHCLAPPVPSVGDLDLEFCARSFTLSGGNIRSAATTAGYLAAAGDTAIGMRELISAIQQEYRKLGRLVLEREFGAYFKTSAGTERR